MQHTATLLWESLLILLLNIPFGYWRIHVPKFSWQWVLAIHIPVPFIITLRIFTSVGFAWYTYLFMVTAFFLGQQIGSWLGPFIGKRCHDVTSCLFMDFYRCLFHHG
ncbi:MAG: hypothetical protein P8100_04705 [bacterium]